MILNNTPILVQQSEEIEAQLRKTTQPLMPIKLMAGSVPDDEYNLYPIFKMGDDKIFNGYESLAQWIIEQKTVAIDGYEGVLWNEVRTGLQNEFLNAGISVNWIETNNYLKPAADIDKLIEPFLGTPDSVWGKKCLLTLKDFYMWENLSVLLPSSGSSLNILFGTGAALVNWDAPLIYIDLPKNELQFRMRAGSVTNLGTSELAEPFLMYKRCYFVDWVLCNKHKKQILEKIDVIADGQWLDNINWMFKADFIDGLNQMSRSIIRVRPWFEPGAWGGQWLKQHIAGINKDAVNYAWSFELIVPENGLVFESDGHLLEVSFDFLMFHNSEQVLGRHALQYGDEFPIRFDFLDTYDGGDLSIQCHPRLKYIQENFGEQITQDETYYILDCKPGAEVYLGFQQNIDAIEFQNVLVNSQNDGVEINIKDFVKSHDAHKHDLFLIPNGTIHSAGADNMILEISATPYIFTFKMYDWLRLDLDGNPRPINIDHAFKNLDFERKGDLVKQKLIAKPAVMENRPGYQLTHLPTHQDHFYDVHRLEFDDSIEVSTDNCCHVMMLVEGKSIVVETANGSVQSYAFAETFVIPAAAGSYKIKNMGKERAKVIKAFIKY